jgi:hypothetical protein
LQTALGPEVRRSPLIEIFATQSKAKIHKRNRLLAFVNTYPLFLRNSFYRTDSGAGAAALTFGGVDPAFAFLFGNGVHWTLAVAGTAVYTGIPNFRGHAIPPVQ